MITLKQWIELVDYRITEGSEYHQDGFGDNQYSLTSWNGEHNGYSFNIVFDTRTQIVYLVEACDYKNSRAYRRIADGYKLPEPEQAWDDVNWTTLDVDDDFIQKALAIRAGEPYDTKISVPLDLSDDELLRYMKMAHELDITFNEFIERALTDFIERHQDELGE